MKTKPGFIRFLLPVLLLGPVSAIAQITNPAPYCVIDQNRGPMSPPRGTDTVGDGIINVSLGSLNNKTNGFVPDSTYVYYNSITAPVLAPDSSYNLSVTFGASMNAEPMYYAAWIDFNGDNNFSAGELIMSNTGGKELSYGITEKRSTAFKVPATAVAGIKRMRIVRAGKMNDRAFVFDPGYTLTPCFALSDRLPGFVPFGETEDYNVEIKRSAVSPRCDTVTALTVSAITSTSATITWKAVTASSGYQYLVNEVSTAPSGAGTAIATVTTTVSALKAGKTYYAHVRNTCGGSNYSAWTTQKFDTKAATSIENVHNNNDLSINIFPNPTDGFVKIAVEGNISNTALITLHDITGRILSTYDAHTSEINLKDMTPGLYLLQYTDGTYHQIFKLEKR